MRAFNAAHERLLEDYTRFHAVLVVVGGLFMLAILVLSVAMLFRARRSVDQPRVVRRARVVFGMAGVATGLGLALIVAANLSNVVQSARGLEGTIDHVRYRSAYQAWMESGSAQIPAVIQARIDERVAWQLPKAVICGVALMACVALGVYLWRVFVRRARAEQPTGGVLLGITASVLAGFVLMLMVMGNTQAAAAPLVMTLVYG